MAINFVKVASVLGMALGLAGTLVSNWAGQKSMDDTIAKKVAEALANQNGNQ